MYKRQVWCRFKRLVFAFVNRYSYRVAGEALDGGQVTLVAHWAGRDHNQEVVMRQQFHEIAHGRLGLLLVLIERFVHALFRIENDVGFFLRHSFLISSYKVFLTIE